MYIVKHKIHVFSVTPYWRNSWSCFQNLTLAFPLWCLPCWNVLFFLKYFSLNKPHVRRGKTQTCEKSNLFSIDVHIMFRTSLLYAVLIVESQKTKPYSQWECIKTKIKYKNIEAMKVHNRLKKEDIPPYWKNSVTASWVSVNSSHPEMKTKLKSSLID